MARHRRYLVMLEVMNSSGVEFAQTQEERFAACPEAAQYADAEVEDFLAAAQYMDNSEPRRLTEALRRARIAFPPELSFDLYRLGRHLFRRWQDPAVPQAFLTRAVEVDYRPLLKLRRKGDIAGLVSVADHDGAPVLFHMMRRLGMADLIPAVQDAFGAEQAARARALYQFGRLTLHRFLTEPEPARQPTRWEQHKLRRRIHMRELQVRSLRKNLVSLRQERKTLLTRLRSTERQEYPELETLAAELDQLKAAQAAARERHAAALAEQARRHQEALAVLRAQLAAAQQDFSETLAVRSSWLSVAGGGKSVGGLAVPDSPGGVEGPEANDGRASRSRSDRCRRSG